MAEPLDEDLGPLKVSSRAFGVVVEATRLNKHTLP